MGYYFFMNGAVVSWSSKKQKIVSISITGTKYIALRHVVQKLVVDLIWYEDNKINIALTKNAESQYCTKHIDVQHHYIRELVNEKEFTIE